MTRRRLKRGTGDEEDFGTHHEEDLGTGGKLMLVGGGIRMNMDWAN